MPRSTRKRLETILAGLSIVMVAPLSSANEIWVSPTHVETAQLNLIWPVTQYGLARFGFAVPDDLASFSSAKIVFLPTASVVGTYSIYAEMKRGGETVSIFDVAAQENVPVSFAANQLTEVDISSLLGGLFDPTSNGADYVSVLVYTPGDPIVSARILGLRFGYDPFVIETSDIEDGAVTSAKIANGTIAAADIANGAVTGAKIANATITGADVAPSSLTGSDVQDRSLNGVDLALGTVTGAEIQDGSVALADLAANSVDGSKIATNAVTTVDVLNESLTGVDIQNRTLTGGHFFLENLTGNEIMNNSLTGADVQDGSIGNADLADNAVTGPKVQSNSITSAHIIDGTIVADDIATNAIRGAEISIIQHVAVGCDGECSDSNLGNICDVIASGWEPIFVAMSHNFSFSGGTGCGGDNLCVSGGTLSRSTNLATVCQDGNGGDCRVYCVAP